MTIPGTIDSLPVTSIGDYAFADCTSLASVTIPYGVTNIGSYTFQNCSNLMSITIPSSVTIIGDYAFQNCTSLTGVTIPNSVKSIGNYAFSSCTSLAAITVSALNSFYSSVAGVLFNKGTNTLILCPRGKAGNYTMPNSVRSIWWYDAFTRCSSLTSVLIPNSVTSIGDEAFYECTSLTSVPIPNSVTSIGIAAFYVCTNLTSITIPNSVTSIGRNAFAGCWSLTSVTIPSSVTSIEVGTFNSCISLTNVVIPSSVTSIGTYAFESCFSLTGVYFKGNAPSLPYLDWYVFDGDYNATVFYLAGKSGWGSRFGGLPTLVWDLNAVSPAIASQPVSRINMAGTIATFTVAATGTAPMAYRWLFNGANLADGGAISGTTTTNLTIAGAQTNHAGSYSVLVANAAGSVTSSVAVLTVVPLPYTYTINNGTITITGYTGSGGAVTILSTINGLPVTSIGDYAFSGCTNLTSVTIPNSVTSIGNGAFEICTSLTNVTIPDSVSNIGPYAFFYCNSLTAITVDTDNPAYSSVAGVLFDKSQTALIQYPAGKAGAYTVPNSVTSIGQNAFLGCTGLTGVYFQGNAPSLGGTNVFSNVNAPVYYLPGTTGWGSTFGGRPTVLWGPPYTYTTNNSTITITKYAGSGGTVSIPSTINGLPVTSIGAQAFYYCTNLTSVTIPSSVTSIGRSAFYACTSLTNVTIPKSVTSIGDYAFYNCSSLTTVTIPNSVTRIGNDAFESCWSLNNVTIGNGVTNIGDWAFCFCGSLTRAYFQGNAPSLGGTNVFYHVNASICYLPGTTGWGSTFGGRPTALWMLPKPLILNIGPSFGVQTNLFGFIISWATNIPVVIEACTNPANPIWSPVKTNTLTGGWSYFSDSRWTNYTRRFYRIRSP